MSNKAKTSTMKTKRELKPKLRFPEFRDEPAWEDLELGPMTEKVGSGITPRGGEANYKTAGRPFVRSQNVGWGELILNDVAFIDEETHASFSSSEIEMSDVLLNISGASIGRSAIADARIVEGNVNQHVCIIRVKPRALNSVLLCQYLISQLGQEQINAFQAGGNRQGLNFGQIRSFLIPLPPTPKEQTQIADCLLALDELITAHGRKLAAIKAHKKGLMQQLFPREGESQPHIRFPKFRNASEWEEKKVGEVFQVTRGEVLSMTLVKDEKTSEAQYPVYSSRTKSNGLSGYYSDYLYENAITWTTDGANAGDVNYRAGRFYCTNVCGVLINREGYANHCIAALINSLSRKHVSYVGNPKLMNAVMAKIVVPFPTIEEQHKISDCLSSLDDLIAAHTEKMESLKTHKKGLMQQLFPSPEEDDA